VVRSRRGGEDERRGVREERIEDREEEGK